MSRFGVRKIPPPLHGSCRPLLKTMRDEALEISENKFFFKFIHLLNFAKGIFGSPNFVSAIDCVCHSARRSHTKALKAVIREFLEIPFLHWEHIALITALAAHRHHHFGATLIIPPRSAHIRIICRFDVHTFGLTRVICVNR